MHLSLWDARGDTDIFSPSLWISILRMLNLCLSSSGMLHQFKDFLNQSTNSNYISFLYLEMFIDTLISHKSALLWRKMDHLEIGLVDLCQNFLCAVRYISVVLTWSRVENYSTNVNCFSLWVFQYFELKDLQQQWYVTLFLWSVSCEDSVFFT